ncbi:hypothetical protein N802_10785 [Knoellia sinensis KCTC 19936]|uniref:Uncharacterized protein n=1 Tax=Knoellia sinensis KCTC 19936 TaxID=1385520 RepID=A0A0A0J4G5_9MICO|nr:hypothetical protein [Knoellia sinensis]KGN32078.1 hypothetical protein N802_10785 [Knoellia sinensis KCTC 19936]
MSDTTKKTAGAFDIRNFIGLLLGLYGIILTLMGLFGDKELDKTGGVNANLWTGLALLVVAAGFMAWAKARPTVVPDHVERPPDDETRPAPRNKPKPKH